MTRSSATRKLRVALADQGAGQHPPPCALPSPRLAPPQEERDNWLNPAGADEATLKKRTLTNLCNQRRPGWTMRHRALDRAVLAASTAGRMIWRMTICWRDCWRYEWGAGGRAPWRDPLR